MRPLTERQQAIVRVLATARQPMVPNAIALRIGLDRDRARRVRGPWAGPMAPAQRIIGSLNGLRNTRGLVQTARRPDGRSGTAYVLTEAGRAVARELEATT